MLRSELIARLQNAPGVDRARAERMVDAVFEEISAALERGDRVEIRGFGAFSVRRRDARTGRNPRTGASVDVREKRAPYFKPGKELRAKLNAEVPPDPERG